MKTPTVKTPTKAQFGCLICAIYHNAIFE